MLLMICDFRALSRLKTLLDVYSIAVIEHDNDGDCITNGLINKGTIFRISSSSFNLLFSLIISTVNLSITLESASLGN